MLDEQREPYRPPADHHWRDWNARKRRYRAYDPNGVFKETLSLSGHDRERYEAKGWTFTNAGTVFPKQ